MLKSQVDLVRKQAQANVQNAQAEHEVALSKLKHDAEVLRTGTAREVHSHFTNELNNVKLSHEVEFNNAKLSHDAERTRWAEHEQAAHRATVEHHSEYSQSEAQIAHLRGELAQATLQVTQDRTTADDMFKNQQQKFAHN